MDPYDKIYFLRRLDEVREIIDELCDLADAIETEEDNERQD